MLWMKTSVSSYHRQKQVYDELPFSKNRTIVGPFCWNRPNTTAWEADGRTNISRELARGKKIL